LKTFIRTETTFLIFNFEYFSEQLTNIGETTHQKKYY